MLARFDASKSWLSATDVYRVAEGRVAENWHIEDNLSLQQQLGLISK